MNTVTLVGNVTRQPIYHFTDKGFDLVRLILSTPSADDKPPQSHNCLAWGPAALDLHEHITIGDRLLIRGVLEYVTRHVHGYTSEVRAIIVIKAYSYLGKGDIVSIKIDENYNQLLFS